MDPGGQMARLGVIGKAERIVHGGQPLLLVQLNVQDVRMVDRPNGATDWVRVGDGRLSYLPLTIACDAVTLDAAGKREKPHYLSPCGEPTKVATPFAVPLFLVFRYPKPGPAKVTIPATVHAPDAPLATRRDAPPPRPPPGIDQKLLGERELVLQVLVPGTATPR